MKSFSGVFTALVTPFKNGEIDWVSLTKLVKFQVSNGINGFVINGTTAESPTLSKEEKQKIFKHVRAEVGAEFPLVMGTGSNSTSETIAATQDAEAMGADAVLVVVPYYNKPPQRGLFQHFQKVAASTQLPVILYNVPGRTITKLEAQTIAELSHLPNVIGVKDATGDMVFGKLTADQVKENFMITSGDDGTFLDLMKHGGKGVISVASHIMPKKFVEWCKRTREGDSTPRSEFSDFEELNNYLYVEANPIPIKMALKLMGIIESAELRLPLVQLSEPYTAELKSKMQKAGLL